MRLWLGAIIVVLCSCSDHSADQETIGVRSYYQCINGASAIDPSTLELPPLTPHPTLPCQARLWQIPRMVYVTLTNDDQATMWVNFPYGTAEQGLPALLDGESVVVQGNARGLSVYARTGSFHGNQLIPTGEHVFTLPVMRDGIGRQRYLVGDSFLVILWLKEDGEFSLGEIESFPAMRLQLNAESEAVITLQKRDLEHARDIALAVREQFSRWAVPGDSTTRDSQ
ncbi:MAG: hypothetical protein GFH27_549333n6 [Chloroflexi bacterium AL-W]|nr:hypothetical protein [Chloroflexi bacterium AL-N1]NOK70541.1 hypothetical protein [Chloroflexi bacterium AL-N10]NOK78100.1 hypothetical protein [Chloroflexi bacterium AL-N5]NOK85199.1 hypothetical protein [Chloroflexi bacterium AL-W]